jgi:hypothetical protein
MVLSSIFDIFQVTHTFNSVGPKGCKSMIKQNKITIETTKKYLGFEVLLALVMKSTTFWDIAQCSPLKVNRRFGGTYRLHLQDQKIS